MFAIATLAVLARANEFGFGKLQEPYEKDKLSPLEEYVHRYDPNWSYEREPACEEETEEYTLYCVKMYSQKWLDTSVWYSETHENSIWWHYQTIIVPKVFSTDLQNKAYMQIEAGSNRNIPNIHDDEDIQMAKLIAVKSGMVTSILQQVPNQPIKFYGDWWQENGEPKARKEDQFCSYTWRLFMNDITDDEMPETAKGWGDEMIAYLPMTKSAVKGLDTIEDFMANLNNPIDGFLVAGGSKRGWTTWFTGVVEPKRVLAIAPVVMDLLNMHVSLKHSFMSMGNWTFAFEDFTREDLMAQLDDPVWQNLQQIIDPFNYRKKLANLPKYAISCSGDPFFLVDDNKYYLSKMEGEMHAYLMGNCEHSTVGHSLTNQNVFLSAVNWFRAIVNDRERPKFEWEEGSYHSVVDGNVAWAKINVTSNLKPVSVVAKVSRTKPDYTGADFHRRDWRWLVPQTGDKKAKYDVRPVEVVKHRTIQLDESNYYFDLAEPIDGWAAFWFEATFDLGNGEMMPVTSETTIVPNDKWLVDECFGIECRGSLV